jgi:hypothetical protein
MTTAKAGFTSDAANLVLFVACGLMYDGKNPAPANFSTENRFFGIQ